MAIVYTPNIPQATDQISQSQPQILENFTGINTLIAVDHATFASANAGFHNKVTLPVQGSIPTFSGTNLGLYSFIPTSAPLTTVPELFVRKQDGTKVPMTASKANQIGYTMLPSGMVIKWGFITTSSSSVTVTFDTTIPFSAVYAVMATPYGVTTTTVQVQVATTTSFIAKLTGAATASFYYMAIGLANL